MRKLSNLMGKTGTAGNAGTSSGGASADNSSAAVMEVKVNVTAIGENGATVNVNFGGFAANESNQWYLLIRPSKLFADALSKEKKNSDAMQAVVFEQQQEKMRQMMNKVDSQTQHQTFVANTRKLEPFRREAQRIWDEYARQAKILVGETTDQNQRQPNGGYFVLCNDGSKFLLSTNEAESNCLFPLSKVSVELPKTLRPNCFFEFIVCVVPKKQGEEPPQVLFKTEPKAFTTKASYWQSALEDKGLKHLIDPFLERRLDSMESWLEIPDDVKLALSIDNTIENKLNDILFRAGIVSTADKARLAKENDELKTMVTNLVKEYSNSVALELYQMGDPVLDAATKLKFGVVVEPSQTARSDPINIRWVSDMSLVHDPANAPVVSAVSKDIVPGKFTLFLSHAQADSQNQVAHLSLLLRDRGCKVWFDQDAERLEAKDMVRGIANSEVFVLFLSKSYLDRYYCRLEFLTALAMKKKMVFVFESDERHGGMADYVGLVDFCTKKYPEFKPLLLSTEAIGMSRRAFQRKAVVDEIMKRVGASKTISFPAGKAATSNSSANRDLEEMKNMVLELTMEVNDLKQENVELWKAVKQLLSNNQ